MARIDLPDFQWPLSHDPAVTTLFDAMLVADPGVLGRAIDAVEKDPRGCPEFYNGLLCYVIDKRVGDNVRPIRATV